MNITEYIKEYIRITLTSIKTPETFFRGIPDREKDSMKPAIYLILSLVVCLLLRPEVLFFISGNIIYTHDPLVYGYSLVILILVIAFILILSLLYVSVMHFVARFVGGKGKIEDTFMVFCYSASPLNLIWILNFFNVFLAPYGYYFETWIFFLISMLWIECTLYMLYIMITGISVRSGITKSRAFAAAMVQPIVIILVFLFMIFISSQSSYYPGIETYVPQEILSGGFEESPVRIVQIPQKYDLTAYLGSAPIIDGKINGDDIWKEGMNVQMDVRGISYTITAKHNRENLYVLVQWKGQPVWKERIMLLFKQDHGVPIIYMNTGLVDMYSLKYDHSIFEDWHFVNDYITEEHQDGSAKFSLNNNNNEMVIEWKIPLNSGDDYDIYINNYPAQLGFSIMNDGDGGIFPADAHQYDPETWANLVIADTKKP